jgi:tetratricopeptide (TPR) repeat protein
MKFIKVVSFVVAFILILSAHLSPCTIIMIAGKGYILAGNNEDHDDPFAKMWFIPASKGEYGRVCLGFEFPWVEGGMNDQGLFIDSNALPPTGYVPDPNKPTRPENRSILDQILAQCASVDDVIAFFQKWNDPHLSRGKFPVADRSGASAVIEWGREGLQFNRKSSGYQISTNFVTSNFEKGAYPCNRYRTAETMLSRAEKFDIALVRSILSATHFEGGSPTVYSNICDLRNGLIYIYNYHDFENPVIVDLKEELKKGAITYDLPSLFKIANNAHLKYLQRHAANDLGTLVQEKDSSVLVSQIRGITRKYQPLIMENLKIDEDSLHNFGFQLLNARNVMSAFEVFRFISEEYPLSSRAHENFGKVYIYIDDRTKAVEQLSRALSLDPENSFARKTISRLEAPDDIAFDNIAGTAAYRQIPGSYSFTEKGVETMTFFLCGGTLWTRAESAHTPTRIHPIQPGSLTFRYDSADSGRIEWQFNPDEKGRITSCRFRFEKRGIDALGTRL